MKVVRLREVCLFNPPKTEARKAISSDQLVGFMPMQDLRIGSKYVEASTSKPLGEVIKAYTYFADNDVLIAKITPCFENGKMGIARNLENGVGFGSSEYFVLRPTDSLLSEYLYYFLRQEFVIENGRGIMTGAVGHRRVPGEYLENLEIPLPPLEKQCAIVEKLDSAFAEIELIAVKTEEEKSESKELFRQICKEFFQNLYPTGYSSLKDLSRVITKGTTPTSIGQNFVSKGINFLKVESLDQVGGFVENKFAFIDADCHQVLGRSQLQKDDLLVSIAGALGRTAMVTDEVLPANINQALALVRLPSESKILPQFIFSLFQAGFFDEVVGNMSAGAAQQNLSLAQIGSFQIPILDSKQQLMFIAFIANLMECTDEFVAAMNRKKELLSELKSSVLSSVFANDSRIVEVA